MSRKKEIIFAIITYPFESDGCWKLHWKSRLQHKSHLSLIRQVQDRAFNFFFLREKEEVSIWMEASEWEATLLGKGKHSDRTIIRYGIQFVTLTVRFKCVMNQFVETLNGCTNRTTTKQNAAVVVVLPGS